MTEPNLLEESLDFSLVLGGPLFQLFQKSHLAGDSLDLLYRRLLTITLVAWLPVFLLATLGSSVGNVGRLFFVHDVEVHVRFLIALPILVAAELIVHTRKRPVVRNFIERRIVLPQDLPRFHSAIESAIRPRNSLPVLVSFSVASLQNQHKSRSDSPRSLRWSRLPGLECLCLRPILFAQGALLAGVIASRVFYRGESLLSFKFQVGDFKAFFVLAILGPLLMFTPQMAPAERKGLADYGLLEQRYVESFEQKWVLPRYHPFRRTSWSCRYPATRRSRQQLCPRARDAFGPLRTREHLPPGSRHRSPSFASPAYDFFAGESHRSHNQNRVLKESSRQSHQRSLASSHG